MPSLKNDHYRKKRGGYSRWLDLSCDNCQKQIMIYQKDGAGRLKRLYLDRIIEPKNFQADKNLKCPDCQIILGTPIVYKKEGRPAYRLFVGAIAKKIIKSRQNV